MFEKLVDLMYKTDKEKLIDMIKNTCPSSIGINEAGGEHCNVDCEECWRLSLEESKYTDFVKF